MPCGKAVWSFFCCYRVHQWLLQNPVLSTMCLLHGFSSRALLSQNFVLHHPLQNCGVWLEWYKACFADGWFREDNLAGKHRVFHLLAQHLWGIWALVYSEKSPVGIFGCIPWVYLTCCSSHGSIPAMGISHSEAIRWGKSLQDAPGITQKHLLSCCLGVSFVIVKFGFIQVKLLKSRGGFLIFILDCFLNLFGMSLLR